MYIFEPSCSAVWPVLKWIGSKRQYGNIDRIDRKT